MFLNQLILGSGTTQLELISNEINKFKLVSGYLIIIIGTILLIKFILNNLFILPQIFNLRYYLYRYNYKIYKRELPTKNVYIIKLYNKLNIHIGYLSLGSIRTKYDYKTEEFNLNIGHWNKGKEFAENAIDIEIDYYNKDIIKTKMLLPDNFDEILDSEVREIVNDYNVSTENSLISNFKRIF